MNSSRHANRSSRGRGRGNRQQSNRADYTTVPNTQQVVPGTAVSIVLKIDQQTGKQVQGTVAELLTRGNHPRGIKVRLQDGRVGRVQRMASGEEARVGSEGMTGLGRNGESLGYGGGERSDRGGAEGERRGGGMGGGGGGGRYTDFRVDAPDQPEREEASLLDYVVVKSKGKGKKGVHLEADPMEGNAGQGSVGRRRFASSTSAVGLCPVCGMFEGDEMAIAHHVNEHFD